ncbi:hypothetical protein LH452_14745 [Laribacter hongkongensis]|uniref:hypothetical protein n=1 Tax=Laribacter hongkongensis TaxID=168471 RepID=UPI001EFCC4EC|nr:hypothetical protein [Laribacter hongkongensis]MCG9060148.1 hypothetical protein [Laribacter hongkongensis]MCG9084089.1 hypothetical protein [Laribacter hongkongensis]MCG9087245.1 hypothetical protein [Laribacter hongkongensis]
MNDEKPPKPAGRAIPMPGKPASGSVADLMRKLEAAEGAVARAPMQSVEMPVEAPTQDAVHSASQPLPDDPLFETRDNLNKTIRINRHIVDWIDEVCTASAMQGSKVAQVDLYNNILYEGLREISKRYGVNLKWPGRTRSEAPWGFHRKVR